MSYRDLVHVVARNPGPRIISPLFQDADRLREVIRGRFLTAYYDYEMDDNDTWYSRFERIAKENQWRLEMDCAIYAQLFLASPDTHRLTLTYPLSDDDIERNPQLHYL